MDDELENLNITLEQSGIKLGISNAFSNPVEMRRHYIQAVFSADMDIPSNQQVVRHYIDYAIYHSLALAKNDIDVTDLCHPALLRLAQSTKQSDRDILDSLYMYLKADKSIERAAKELHIHKNTLFYRIDKIKRLSGINITDGEGMLKILFSFKVLAFIGLYSV